MHTIHRVFQRGQMKLLVSMLELALLWQENVESLWLISGPKCNSTLTGKKNIYGLTKLLPLYIFKLASYILLHLFIYSCTYIDNSYHLNLKC